MSAICGILCLGGSPLPPDALERMLRPLAPHGPDGSGRWQDQIVGMGHQMMHSTPESLQEHLPYYDAESRLAITSDARLDNREDLAETLGVSLHEGLADSRLIVEAYLKWGTDCARRLVGEFAFVIWDGRSRCLHCVTDPMGLRPLFYREIRGTCFAFASEVVPLMAISDVPPPINERRLAMLGVSAMSTYLEPEATCFETIFRVPAATILSMGKGGMKLSEYWRPDHSKRLRFKSDAECGEAFREVFFKAVKARLRSAFPVASLLSGGLDSSGIVAAAGRILADENRSLVTLSAVPMPSAEGKVIDERQYIDLFKDHPNLEMRYVPALGRGPFDDLDRLVRTASLCSYSFQHFLYTELLRAARADGARVVLDGHGGEHSATCHPEGYLAELFLAARWRTLARELRCADRDHQITLATVKRQVLKPLLPWSLLRLFNRHSKFDHLVEYPLRPDYIRDILGRDVDQVRQRILKTIAPCPDHRRDMARSIELERSDIRARSHAGMIDYQDVTFAYPYLDKRVLEFSLAVDGRFKYQDGNGRRLLKLAMGDSMPPAILKRSSKAPFSPDYHLRYELGRSRARAQLQDFSRNQKLASVVDFRKVLDALEHPVAYSAQNPMRMDYRSQFLVPFALYLCYFLENFATGNGRKRMQS